MGVKNVRISKGLRQNYVAKQLGITVRHYQRIENEGRRPTQEQAEKLVQIFGCKMSQLNDKERRINEQ